MDCIIAWAIPMGIILLAFVYCWRSGIDTADASAPPAEMFTEFRAIMNDINKIADNDRFYVNCALSEMKVKDFHRRWKRDWHSQCSALTGKLTDRLLHKKYEVTSSRKQQPSFINN